MKFDFEIPKELAHLKLDERGYPIPFFAPIINGKANFRHQDPVKREECIARRICSICGRKLPKDYSYIVTGPIGFKNRVCSDTPMHRVCAEFSLRACPHLYFQKSERKEEAGPHQLPEKPPYILLVKISKFRGKWDDAMQGNLIHYTPAFFERYDYVDNILQRSIHLDGTN